ncbi:hypothetical protein PIB30_038577 [Stylosanthes scabra]|uniref:Uncharacterized protein n=1 Tax=Stylosanthes scabra TaxID=79078 RepID=A0ABU6ZCN5_9FABA|nr:hypothetical protein [Stylosanthes scabra]
METGGTWRLENLTMEIFHLKPFTLRGEFRDAVTSVDDILRDLYTKRSNKFLRDFGRLAATIAIITSMCSLVSFKRKKEDTNLSTSAPLETLDPTSTITHDLNDPPSSADCKIEVEQEQEEIKELPLPPALQQPKDSSTLPTNNNNNNNNFKRATSERKTAFSLSIKVKRTLSVAKNWEHKLEEKKEREREKEKDKGNIKGKLPEDSIWMKTIILGEKCKTDEVDDPIIYEGKGKRIAAYHPRNRSTMGSSIDLVDTDALCIPHPKTQEETQT